VSDGAVCKGYKGGFRQNAVAGADLIAHVKGLELDAEYSWLYREFTREFMEAYPAAVKARSYADQVWHVRASYTFAVGNQFIEPAVLYCRFNGDRYSMVYPGGRDNLLDIGVNWYIRKHALKVMLHALISNGRARSLYTKGVAADGTRDVRDDCLVLGVQVAF